MIMFSSTLSIAIRLHVALLTRVGDAPQFPFTSKLLVQHFQLVDEFFANSHEHFASRYRSIRLDAKEKFRDVGMSNW